MNISLIASIGISLVLCGAIVYYCNSRLHMVEVAILRQNQVLSSFIANVQNEFGAARPPTIQQEVTSEDLSTPEARASADKIVVSDDENDNDDSDEDDDDSSSESDTEDEDCDTEDNIKVISNDKETCFIQVSDDMPTHHIKIVDVQDLSMFISEINLDTLPTHHHNNSFNQSSSTIYEIEDDNSESDNESDDESDNESKKLSNTKAKDDSIKIGNVVKVDKLDITSLKIKIEPGEEETQEQSRDSVSHEPASASHEPASASHEPASALHEPASTSHEPASHEPASTSHEPASALHEPANQTPLKHDQMRVDDLRKLVVDKHLSTKEEVKKLKKPELLFLLQPLEPKTTSDI